MRKRGFVRTRGGPGALSRRCVGVASHPPSAHAALPPWARPRPTHLPSNHREALRARPRFSRRQGLRLQEEEGLGSTSSDSSSVSSFSLPPRILRVGSFTNTHAYLAPTVCQKRGWMLRIIANTYMALTAYQTRF